MKRRLLSSVLPFLPLFLFYIVLVVVFSHTHLIADEGRYMMYAENLTHGFYTTLENPQLRNGPGYPLLISIFALVKAPYIIFKLLNPILMLFAVVFFFKSLDRYTNTKHAMVFTYIFGLYPPLLKWLTYIHSETFAVFLVSGFMYFFLKLTNQSSKANLNILAAGSFLGILALTKVLFGYVIIVMGVICVGIFLWKRSMKSSQVLLVLILGFMFCTPYLTYTYFITGKKLYWGTHGGELLYWRSTPHANEYGDWISSSYILGQKEHDYTDGPTISKNHKSFIQSLEPFSNLERDSIFKKRAIENMKNYPVKYMKNTGANTLRLFFNYPFSYTPQKTSTYFYIIPNMFLVSFLISTVYLAFRNSSYIPFEIRILGLTALIFIGGLILSVGRVRHILPIIPLLLFFIVFVHSRMITIKINKK